jgi:hypothetical protein
MSNEVEPRLRMAIFKEKQIRKVVHNDEWYFSIIDIVEVFTESSNPKKYWSDLKRTLVEDEGFSQLYDKIVKLKMTAENEKKRDTESANTETILRIIQSIHSPKAELFKGWLAKAGYERIQEIEDPELAFKRIRATYKAKGYPDDWVEKRMHGNEISKTFTNEWEQKGVKELREYDILTAEMSESSFELQPSEPIKLTGLERENPRDRMSDMEFIFTMLREASISGITAQQVNQNFQENIDEDSSVEKNTGHARGELEENRGKKVVGASNHISHRLDLETEKIKSIEIKSKFKEDHGKEH